MYKYCYSHLGAIYAKGLCFSEFLNFGLKVRNFENLTINFKGAVLAGIAVKACSGFDCCEGDLVSRTCTFPDCHRGSVPGTEIS